MARSEFKTWLGLDEWAQIMGIDGILFNGMSSPSLHKNIVCGDVFFQHDWQHSDRIGRDTIAMAIQQAEQEISREVGYNLMPEWITEERLDYPRPAFPELYGVGVNVRWMAKSVEALKGHIISGGVRAKSVIQLVAPVVRADIDGDGYAENAVVTVPITITNTNEVHIYYSGYGGSDDWEIKPIKVSISGGFATITFKSWQIPVGTQMEQINIQPLNADLAASYETTVDVYRVYNDPATQLQFLWENAPGLNCCGSCVACQLSTQAGCFHLRDARLGIVVPTPATYDSTTGEFTAQEWSACREPDQIRLWYYSGYRDNNLARPYAELSTYWKYAVAYYAASKFERPVCGCSNINQFIERWRRDAAYTSASEGGITMTAEEASNRLGTSMGAIYAWRRINQNSVRVNK